MHCEGCTTKLCKEKFKCNKCASEYCFDCLNIAPASRKQLSAKQIASLSCPSCQNVTKRKTNCNTPIHKRPDLNDTVNASSSFTSYDSTAVDASSDMESISGQVTLESIGQLLDMKLAPGSSFMTHLRSSLRKDITEMVSQEVNRAVEGLRVDFSQTTDFMSAEQKSIRSKICDKEKEIELLRLQLNKTGESLHRLQNRVSMVEKISRDLNIEIHEVPENNHENLNHLFKKLCECLSVNISDADIKSCRRVAKMNPDSRRPRNILISLSSQRLRDEVLSAFTRYNKSNSKDKLGTAHVGLTCAVSRIYVSEHLSPEAKELHSMARKLSKEKNYKFVWVRFGQIYIRKDEKCPAVHIKNIEIINKLRNE